MESAANSDLRTLVDTITKRRLVEPAIFFLEMGKPLAGCFREVCAVGEPLMQALFGATVSSALKDALNSSERMEDLIQLLESTRASKES